MAKARSPWSGQYAGNVGFYLSQFELSVADRCGGLRRSAARRETPGLDGSARRSRPQARSAAGTGNRDIGGGETVLRWCLTQCRSRLPWIFGDAGGAAGSWAVIVTPAGHFCLS